MDGVGFFNNSIQVFRQHMPGAQNSAVSLEEVASLKPAA